MSKILRLLQQTRSFLILVREPSPWCVARAVASFSRGEGGDVKHTFMAYTAKKVKVKVYAGSHQRALRKGSQLVLTLARAPPKNEKREKALN